MLGAGCAASDDGVTGTSSSSTTTASIESTSSTTTAQGSTIEWFASAWAGPPELTGQGSGERVTLQYGLFGAALLDEAEDGARAEDGPPEPPRLTLTGTSELQGVVADDPALTDDAYFQNAILGSFSVDMERRSFGDPALYVGSASLAVNEGHAPDGDEAEARLRIPVDGIFELSGTHNSPNEVIELALDLARVFPPLPVEPVAVGATWTARLRAQGSDTPIGMISFELLEVQDRTISLGVTSTETHSSFGRGAVETRFEERGQGTVVIDLRTALPIEVAYEFDGVATSTPSSAADPEAQPPQPYTRTLTVDIG